MKLYQTCSCWNPYSIDVKNKSYELDSIVAFNEHGEIVRTTGGWFGNNNHVPEMEIPGDCVRKVKVDYKCKSAFIIKDSSNTAFKNRYTLYIPEKMIGLSDPAFKKAYSGDAVCVSFSTSIPGAYFERYIWIDQTVKAIEHEIRDTGKKISNLYGNFDELSSLLGRLQSLERERINAERRMENVSLESIETRWNAGEFQVKGV